MIDVSFSVEGVEIAARRLSGLADRVGTVIGDSADELDIVSSRIIARAFATGGGSTASGAWKPRTREYAWPILQKERRLVDSLTIGNSDTISDRSPLRWARGTAVPYAKYHQSAKKRKQKADGTDRLPRRAFIDLTDADKQALFRVISVNLTGKRPSIGLPNRGRPSTEG